MELDVSNLFCPFWHPYLTLLKMIIRTLVVLISKKGLVVRFRMPLDKKFQRIIERRCMNAVHWCTKHRNKMYCSLVNN